MPCPRRPPPTRKGVNWSFVANACPAIQYADTEACKQCSVTRDEDAIVSLLQMLQDQDPKKNNYAGIMPPLAANQEEVKSLAKYLATINESTRKTASKLGTVPVK